MDGWFSLNFILQFHLSFLQILTTTTATLCYLAYPKHNRQLPTDHSRTYQAPSPLLLLTMFTTTRSWQLLTRGGIKCLCRVKETIQFEEFQSLQFLLSYITSELEDYKNVYARRMLQLSQIHCFHNKFHPVALRSWSFRCQFVALV